MKTIIVNAYPILRSGSAMIVRQFINYIEDNNIPNRFIIFIHENFEITSSHSNITFVRVKLNKVLTMLSYWQFFGINKWLKKHNINPDITLSLVSTNIIISNKQIPNFLYFHNPVPIYKEYNWSLFKKHERILYLYKNLYHILIKFSINKHTIFFAQLPCIKKRLQTTFNIPAQNIHVVRPSFTKPIISKHDHIHINDNTINLIYPATNFKYKNHQILFDALNILNDSDTNVHLFLTCEKSDFYDKTIPQNITFLGNIKYEGLLSFYKLCDALVFPSYIESFGLPLLEASYLDRPIIVSDSDFAHDLLDDYDNVSFCNHSDPHEWVNAISNLDKQLQLKQTKHHQKTEDKQVLQSWDTLFKIILSS